MSGAGADVEDLAGVFPMIAHYHEDGPVVSIFISSQDGTGYRPLIVNPHRTVERGDGRCERGGPVKGFRIAPINPAKRPAPSKRKNRR